MASTTANIPSGRALLQDPHYNHGTAFTAAEREALGLAGLLPAGVSTLEQQVKRSYEQYQAQPNRLGKNEFLAALHDRNGCSTSKLLEEHLMEMLPVVYDPVVAEAIEHYSHEYRRPDGVYLSVDDPGASRRRSATTAWVRTRSTCWSRPTPRRSSASATGARTAWTISIGKLAVYTAAAGINPDRVIPVMARRRDRPRVAAQRPSLCRQPPQPGPW